ncbi:bifunctional 2-methylcitrate synthase/citrate synthase [Candidatus Marinamargulisbacteria bacterium SCGC AG-414-C22]|nr:bifunctional 2-methylcitrate synthase/citrate synthase [Candidatus Marinamargulisbacteria bacterium SCGC AG-414-C22]
MTKENIYKGLHGVYVDETHISNVDPEKSILYYRGYPVHDLTQHCSFEEVAFLLLYGKLPNQTDYDTFCRLEQSYRKITQSQHICLRQLNLMAHPMDNLRTMVSILGCDQDDADIVSHSIQLIAKIPTIVAAIYRLNNHLDIIEPQSDLTIAENFFYMCFGDIPDDTIIDSFNTSLILYAEHSFNASTFTARVITSSLSDIYGAITGAIASLKGHLHGGANEAVMHMMLELSGVKKIDQWLLDKLSKKEKIMGFGHRVYRKGDSRVPMMRDCFFKIAELKNNHHLPQLYKALEQVMIREKGIFPNLDFPAGPAYYLMGFPINLFTPIFVMSRIVGWSAHVKEQLEHNKLIRPLSVYTGHIYDSIPNILDR